MSARKKRLSDLTPVKEASEEEESDLFWSNSTYVKNMFIMVFDWTFIIFSMYLLSFLVKYLPGDKYFNLLMMAIADIAPSMLSGIFMIFLSRKNAMIFLPLFMVLMVPVYYYFKASDLISMGLILVIRFAMTLHYTFVNYAVYEFFPPTHLTFVFGIANIVSGLFTIAAPIAVEVLSDPFLLVLGAGILAAFVSLFLKPVHIHN